MTPAEREDLVLAHQPHVKGLARKFAKNLPSFVDIEDLTSSGNVGLLLAVDRFDPAKDLKFWTFARHRVWGAMVDMLRVGAGRRNFKDLRDAKQLYEFSLDLDTPYSTFIRDIPDNSNPYEEYEAKEQVRLVRNADLTGQEQVVVDGLFMGMRQYDLANFLCVNETRVSQIRTAVIKKVRYQLHLQVA